MQIKNPSICNSGIQFMMWRLIADGINSLRSSIVFYFHSCPFQTCGKLFPFFKLLWKMFNAVNYFWKFLQNCTGNFKIWLCFAITVLSISTELDWNHNTTIVFQNTYARALTRKGIILKVIGKHIYLGNVTGLVTKSLIGIPASYMEVLEFASWFCSLILVFVNVCPLR